MKLELVALFCLVAGCTAGPAETELVTTDTDDAVIHVSMTDEAPIDRRALRCESEYGCRLSLRLSPRTTGALVDPLMLGTNDLMTTRLVIGNEVVTETVLQLIKYEGGGFNIEGRELDEIVPQGPLSFEFEKGAGIPPLTVDITLEGPAIADPNTQAICHDTCDLYDQQACLPTDLANACHAGCSVASRHEIDVFSTCALEDHAGTAIDRCDTFCFYAIPGVVRFAGGCDDDSDCPTSGDPYVCRADVCIPAPAE